MKQLFILINLILLTVAAYLSVRILYENSSDAHLAIRKPSSAIIENTGIAAGSTAGMSLNKQGLKIMERNVFQVQTAPPMPDSRLSEKVDEKKETRDAVRASPALKLIGTVTGPGPVFAVIENTQKRAQSLYQTGDIVQGAVIREISTGQVIITVDGSDQYLEMKAEPMVPDEPASKSLSVMDTEEIIVETSAIIDSRMRPDEVKQEVKIKPQMTDGMVTGLMLYNIRPQSLFDQLGFKNGDILREVDGHPIQAEDPLPMLFQSLEDTSVPARAVILRRGSLKEFVFHVQDDSGTIQGHPEQSGPTGDE